MSYSTGHPVFAECVLMNFIRALFRFGRGASVVGVAASVTFLAGCETTTQTPVLCDNAEVAKRDPRCKPATRVVATTTGRPASSEY
jgi:uncharacterized lipoprotein YajG